MSAIAPIPVTAIVLAGGNSSRMGQDKALIPVAGVPMLRRVVDVAADCTDAVYVVTPWVARYAPILPECCHFVPEETGEDGTAPQRTPLSGFATGLARVQTAWVLLLACDLPHLQVSRLQQGIRQLAQVPPEAIALLAKHPKGWEPFCGFYRRACLDSLLAYLERGGRSFQGWLASETVASWEADDLSMWFNCNTPQDLDMVNPPM